MYVNDIFSKQKQRKPSTKVQVIYLIFPSPGYIYKRMLDWLSFTFYSDSECVIVYNEKNKQVQ